MSEQAKYLAITGGVGGAKLALGFAHILPPDRMAFLVNTGDDFEHLGLHISPDLDTLMYTLSGSSNPDMGWGRAEETWNFIESLGQLGGEDWFRLGDRDLAVHVTRTLSLAAGEPLTEVTAKLCRAMGITHPVFPMSNDPVRTVVHTEDEALAFQHYFVRDRCEPKVKRITFDGYTHAAITPQTYQWLRDPQLAGIVICPSNPFISVDPILSVPGAARASAGGPRTGGRRVADRWRGSNQRADRQDNARALERQQRAPGGAPLWRLVDGIRRR